MRRMLAYATVDEYTNVTVTLEGYGDSAVLTVDQGGYIRLNGGSAIVAESQWQNVTVLGTSGPDWIDLSGLGAHGYDLQGGAGADTLIGCAGYGYLEGEDGDDSLVGSGYGFHYLMGGEGNDTLCAGPGSGDEYNWGDYLQGGTGDDLLWGGEGNDSFWGGDGDDTILTAGGNDLAYGGNGDTTDTGSASAYGDDVMVFDNLALQHMRVKGRPRLLRRMICF